jgi:multiple sugar transport system substrate-binding protein
MPMSAAQNTPVAQKQKVVLKAMLTDLGQIGKWDILIGQALQQLKAKHPDMDIQVQYIEAPDSQTREHFLAAMTNQTPIDLVSVDQIWLGEFAQKGYLTDLTNRSISWGRIPDFYQNNIDGMTYNQKIYGIWAWTDIRGLWYWKDLLNNVGVTPNSLSTWDGYIAAAKKLDAALRPQGIEGVHLNGVDNSPDMWYPYLWELGGNIVTYKNGHPVPAFNSSAGVRALGFLKEQVDAGIKPQKTLFEHGFANRKFAVMLAGSWMPGQFPPMSAQAFKQKIGFLPMFPVPDASTQTSTTMGGWEVAIPTTSKHKDLSWELITMIMEPKNIAPWLEHYGYLPTQATIGQGRMLNNTESSFPYYNQMISMIPLGHSRPSIPQYPLLAQNVRHAIDNVYSGLMTPKQALDEAAANSSKVLG